VDQAIAYVVGGRPLAELVLVAQCTGVLVR
jgi:hypothetical protein